MDRRQTIRDQTDAALTLSRHVISSSTPTSNLVFSPASINVVLSMIAAGSSGETKQQLLSFLRSRSVDNLNAFASELVLRVFADGSASGGPRLSAVNGVWIDKSLSFKDSFKEAVEGSYKAALNQVDFQTKADQGAAEVNSWAEKHSNGLVEELLPPGSVDSTTRLIFANALYFKGAWDEKFDASETKEYDFHVLNGMSVHVPFMTSEKKQFVSAYDDFKVLQLPYRQGQDKRRFSMCFFLPDAKDGLPALIEKVGSGSGFLDRHIPHHKVEVGVFKIPRFKISYGFEASNVLEGLGLTLPFLGGGLTEMVNSPAIGKILYVSDIFHKSFVEVNEEGTDAAAATAATVKVGCCRCLVRGERIDFVADHPFLFLIREDVTGVVLFIGQVLNPLEAS